eukprot:4839357-Lingulodinium_polyedra.AAC.1
MLGILGAEGAHVEGGQTDGRARGRRQGGNASGRRVADGQGRGWLGGRRGPRVEHPPAVEVRNGRILSSRLRGQVGHEEPGQ